MMLATTGRLPCKYKSLDVLLRRQFQLGRAITSTRETLKITGVTITTESKKAWHLSSVTIWHNSLRYVSSRKATELAKRKEIIETDEERLEYHVFNISSEIRRIKRINKVDIVALMELLERGTSIGDHGTFLLTCCSDYLPDMKPQQRVAVAQKIWSAVQKEKKESLDNFNALLRCYTRNEFLGFDPLKTLEDFKKMTNNIRSLEIQPSRLLTYYYVLLSYCQRGDLTNAVKVLNMVKDEELPVDEQFFNALILGNSRLGDLNTAKEILNIMRSTHVEPSSRTYSSLMQAYIEHEKSEELNAIYKAACKEIQFAEKDILHLAFIAVLKEDEKAIEKILEWFPTKLQDVFPAYNCVASLVHHGYPFQALRLFLKCVEKIQIPAADTSGKFLIKELVYSNTDLEAILSICETLKEKGYNLYGLNAAAEYSLKAKRFDLTFSIFEKMKENGVPIRAHYFWPIFLNLFESEGIRGITETVQKMLKLEVTPDWETKNDYLVPKMFQLVKDPVDVAKILKDSGGLSYSSGILKAILIYLLRQNRLKEASNLCTSLRGTVAQPNAIIDLLLHVLLDFDARETIAANIQLVIPILKFISENVPSEEKNDYVGKFVIRFIEAIGVAMPDLVKLLIRGIVDSQIPVSEATVEMLTHQPQLNSTITVNRELVLNDNLATRIFIHPREMDLSGLESHAEELKAKNLNARGTLRKLFIKYCQSKEFSKALRLKEEFEREYGPLTIGMKSSLLVLYIQKRMVQEALDLYEQLKVAGDEPETGEKWQLDCYKLYDLAAVMTEREMVDPITNYAEAYLLLEDGLSLENISVPEDLRSVTRNVVKLLEAFSRNDNTDFNYVSEITNLLLRKNMIEPCNPILGCVIKHFIMRGDTEGALKLFAEYAQRYRLTPARLQLAYAVLNNEQQLLKYTAICMSVWGPINTKHSLAYAFSDTGDINRASRLFNELGSKIQYTNILKQCEYLGERREIEKILNLIKALDSAERKIDTSKLYMVALKACQRSNYPEDLKPVLAALQEQSRYIPAHVHRFADELKNRFSVPTFY